LWLLLLTTSLCLSQQGLGQQSNTRTVTGVVSNGVTSEPIQRALVQWLGPGGQLSAFTGADGRFSIENVPPNGVLAAQKPGYVQSIPVAAGNGEAQLRLMPNGKITGHVRDSDGEPIHGLQVQLLTQLVMQGRRRWMQTSFAATDEDGFYAFESIQGGRYLLRTLNDEGPTPSSNAPRLVYPARYYPGVPDLASAQAIPVAAGQEATIDFSLRAERAFHVSGSVVGLPSNSNPAFTFSDSEGQMAAFAAVSIANGKFTLNNVPAGSWRIMFQVPGEAGHSYLGRQDFTVDGTDIDGLAVVMERSATIPVTVRHASGPAAQVHLVPVQGNSQENYFAQPRGLVSPTDTERSLFLENVPAGRYRLVVDALGSGCLDSASSGGVDLIRDDLVISPGSEPEPILIDLTNNCATVTGTTESSDKPVAGGFVVAVPTAQGTAKFSPLIGGRRFTLAGLAPGAYELYAVSSLDGLEYANPDALREYHGQLLNLQAGQQVSVTLEMNLREQR
jgi:hypothetical protein